MRGATRLDDHGSIAEPAEGLRRRPASPVETIETSLERIERLQPRLNAFITVAGESARRAARLAEAEIARGRRRGPLHGVPVGIKDFYDTAGIPTTAAFEHFKTRVPGKDAHAVGKLKEAGAIVIGKTNMHALGMGTTGLESAFGPVKNPWNADFIAGGSSSGSAAAVASGLCFATLDTDAIGSCRLPAACCGVVGFKGSYALIDLRGILAGEQPPDQDLLWLSHAGVMARRVENVALVLDAVADAPESFVDALASEREPRVGAAQDLENDAEVSEAFERAVETIRGLGYSVKPAIAPLTDFSKGLAGIERDRRSVAWRRFSDIDLLMLPAAPAVTPSVKEATGNPMALSAEYTMFANYYGLPAIVVPCGHDRRGLPLGLQIVGKRGDDASVLRLAHRYQMASGYADMRPAVN